MAQGVANNLNERKEMFRSMLTDAVAVLVRNTMPYDEELSIEGLIGITADKKDIVLVSINEIIGQAGLKAVANESETPAGKTKSRKRKKMKMSPPEQGKENKIAKVHNEQPSLVADLSKELEDFDVDTFTKKELPDISQVTTPYGGYRNELYNTNDHQQLNKTPTTTDYAPPPPASDPLQQFSTFDFANTDLGNDPASLLSQPHNELLLERLDENGVIVYQCKICQKVIKSKGNFGRHLKSHVNSAVIHTCEMCGKTFGRKDNLRRHLTMVHQVEVPTKSGGTPGMDNGDGLEMSLNENLSSNMDSNAPPTQDMAHQNQSHTHDQNQMQNNEDQMDKPIFPQGEENHASKYFQQHTISSLGLDRTAEGEDLIPKEETLNSSGDARQTNYHDAANNSVQGYFSPQPEAT